MYRFNQPRSNSSGLVKEGAVELKDMVCDYGCRGALDTRLTPPPSTSILTFQGLHFEVSMSI